MNVILQTIYKIQASERMKYSYIKVDAIFCRIMEM